MRQRAFQTGVLANPYKVVEPGEIFEHREAMVWAEIVDDEPAPDVAAEDEPAPDLIEQKKGRRKPEPDADVI